MQRSRVPGIYPDENQRSWQINSLSGGVRIRKRGFGSEKEAKAYLIAERERIRQTSTCEGPRRWTLDEAAAHYIIQEEARGKVSLETDIHLLKRVVRTIGSLKLDQISQSTVQPFIDAARQAGLKSKSINNSLGVLTRICNLAMRSWRDESGKPWLGSAPLIRKLPLDDQRAPRPITWAEQSILMSQLPPHLAGMVGFALQTGVRDNVVCQLRWDWELPVQLDDDLKILVFVVPRRYVKGRKAEKVVVCNPVAQAIVEAQRGKHEEFVFVYRRERAKHLGQAPSMAYQPVKGMSNTAWDSARGRAGLGDLHIHDLRHTVGMRLREAGVNEAAVADVLWHSRQGMTSHYSVAQLQELYGTVVHLQAQGARRNVSLQTLISERRLYQNLTANEKQPGDQAPKLLF